MPSNRWFSRWNSRWYPVVAALVLLRALPAAACFDIDSPPRPFIWFTSATTAQVALEGAVIKAGDINPGDYCGVGLGHSGTLITAVTALTVLDDADPQGGPVALTGLSFAPNATVSGDFSAAAPSSTWQGFHSAVGNTLTGGTYAALVFSITVPAMTTYQDLIAEFQDFGFVGVDDATAGGNLANTNQSIDGIAGIAELAECYDDIQQAGEVCDGATDIGCMSGDRCIECSVCVTPNVANTCKSRIIHDLSFNAKNKLKCYTRGALQGVTADPNCVGAVLDLNLVFLKYSQSCPQTLPSATTMNTLIDTFDGDVETLMPFNISTGSRKCSSSKYKAVSLKAVNAIKCYSKAYQRNMVVDPVCLTRADSKYQQKFQRAELPGLCDAGNTGNMAAVGARVDQFIGDIVANIPPP